MRTIDVTSGGREYMTGVITETTGRDLTNDAVQVSLGTSAAPGVWMVPDLTAHPTPSQVEAALLVGPGTPPGTYVLWLRVADTPEVVDRACRNETVRVI